LMFDGFMAAGVPAPVFWLFVGAAVVIQGVSKSGFAGGAGILSVPLMLLVMKRPQDVAATLLPLLILCDMNAIYHHRRNKVWRHVLAIYIPSVAGILLGALVWWRVGKDGVGAFEGTIKRFVGAIAILFAGYIFAKARAAAWIARFRPGRGTALAAGVTAGFTSTLAHAAGPIVSLYMFAQDMGKTLFVGTVAWTFTLINLTKLPFYVGVGLIRKEVLMFGAALIWLIPIGSFLGKWLHHRVSERAFNLVILVLVLVAGVQLLLGVNLVHLALAAIF